MHDHIKSYISAFRNFSVDERELFIQDFSTLWKDFSSFTPEKRQILKTIKSKKTARIQQRYWEMYLFKALSAQNLEVKMVGNGLDFLINGTIWIEATAPEKNTRHDAPSSRLSSAIEVKKKQFLKHKCAGAIKDDAPFIIAINGSLLWPIDADIEITKGLFFTEDHGDVSGIIFSMINPFHQALHKTNPPLYFIHNPHAKNPVPQKTFKVDKEYLLDGNEITLVN